MKIPENFPEFLPGKETRDIAAKAAGFGNGRTYQQAKEVVDTDASQSFHLRMLDLFMVLQESGGDKISPFGDSLGVPVGARPTPTSVTRPGSFPGALLQKKGFFIAPIAKGSPVKVVWKRTGTGRRQRMTLMYVFARQVHLKPRFGFRDTVRRVAVEGFPRRFAEALRRVLASAR